ncbi:cocaine- and amphetamine-regulated transcript protein-like isoform X2 [Gambusia affinis]|uniref:cocaine- and amphetamine-regulated transcript protein-like isoform X2 n=1 Tax=Gambusia affinis TaxID=33528 RepID=UPI001CDB79A2|nr:cocaine- and amphetamine-regulated transcript protein-like isoform X2 [Gambusia affinis]
MSPLSFISPPLLPLPPARTLHGKEAGDCQDVSAITNMFMCGTHRQLPESVEIHTALQRLNIPLNTGRPVTAEPLLLGINAADGASASASSRPPTSEPSASTASESVSTMVSARMLLLSASCWLLVALGTCDDRLEERSPEYDVIKTEEEKELIEALQEVLEKLKNKQLPSSEKKLGWLPPCVAGEQCAVRKGARIGKLCGCPRGTLCNFSILQCA